MTRHNKIAVAIGVIKHSSIADNNYRLLGLSETLGHAREQHTQDNTIVSDP